MQRKKRNKNNNDGLDINVIKIWLGLHFPKVDPQTIEDRINTFERRIYNSLTTLDLNEDLDLFNAYCLMDLARFLVGAKLIKPAGTKHDVIVVRTLAKRNMAVKGVALIYALAREFADRTGKIDLTHIDTTAIADELEKLP